MERRKFEDSFKQAFEGAEMIPSDKVWANIERDLEKAEGSFKQAFEGAEANPSDNVWMGIELELEKAEGEKTRRRLFYYKMVAAASIAFALCVAGVGYYIVGTKTADLNQQIAALGESHQSQGNNISDNDAEASANTSTAGTDDGVRANAPRKESAVDNPLVASTQSKADQVTSQAVSQNKTDIGTSTGVATQAVVDKNTNQELVSTTSANYGSSLDKYADRSVPSFYHAKNPRLVIPKKEEDLGQKLLLEQRAIEERYASQDKKEKEQTSEKLWTSVGFGAGAFNSVNTNVSPAASNNAFAFNNSSVPDKQSKASGISYSVGLNVGTRLSKRWTIQGGVNYLTQSSDYTATNVVTANDFQTFKAESINELDKLPQLAEAYASSKLKPTVPYSVNNNVKFFSVPVQAGYLLVNRKFGLQLNAGVSTDLFLENTITPEGGSLNATTQGRGDDSPYRSVNFSGLMGTEFSYRLGTHYRISLNPGLRYPLSSVYKSDVGIQSTPLTFDVGLRFKYIFH